MEKISDQVDPRLEPARLAPSAVNGQPWYFTHEGDTIHVHCKNKASYLDVGIAQAHLYVANEETFQFFQVEGVNPVPGYTYVGSLFI